MDGVADKHPQLDVKLHFAEGIVLYSPKSFRTLGCHACVSAFLLQIGGIAGRKDWEVEFVADQQVAIQHNKFLTARNFRRKRS